MDNQICFNTISNFPISVGPEVTIDGQEYEGDSLELISDNSWNYLSEISIGKYGHSAVVLNNEIHIFGGNSNNSVTVAGSTSHYKWDGSAWTQVSTLPYLFYNGVSVVLNNEIHILGGESDSETLRKHYKWDGTSWTSVSTLPYYVRHRVAVILNNELHILGSTHYKWGGTSWVYVGTCPVNNYNYALVWNNEIHLLGNTSHYKWNGTSWTSVSTLPYNFNYQYGGCAEATSGGIYIMGGYISPSSQGKTSHYKWDGAVWTSVSTLPINLTAGASTVLNDEIHILGGANINSSAGWYGRNTHIIYEKFYKKAV